MKAGIFILSAICLLFVSCSKGEGPGGKATISGVITKQNISVPSAEVTEIICSSGASNAGWPIPSVAAYFLLNTPNGHTDYYVWFRISGGGADPALSGRTSVLVEIEGTDDNNAVATKTKNAISNGAGADFIVQQSNDILTVTCRHEGYVVDVEDWEVPFGFDVKEQGESPDPGPVEKGSDERVYIKYGDTDIYSDDFRTDYDGSYQFTGLRKGSYIIYLQSLDPDTGADTLVQKGVEITSSKDEVVVEDINIYY